MGMEPDQEIKYSVGWLYDGLVTTMLGANLAVLIKASGEEIVLKFKYHLMKCQKRRKTPAHKLKPIDLKVELAKIFEVEDLLYTPRITLREDAIREQVEPLAVFSDDDNQLVNEEVNQVNLTFGPFDFGESGSIFEKESESSAES
jgi:hypothetical protein